MLLSIIFLAFLQHIIPVGKTTQIFSTGFLLNLTVFVLLCPFQLPGKYYLIFLLIHHVQIYALMIMGTLYCIRNYWHTKDKEKREKTYVMLLFMLFSGTALLFFLLGEPHWYAVIFSAGFVILVLYMIRLAIKNMLSTYKKAVKFELYQSMAYTDLLTGIKSRNAFINAQGHVCPDQNTCCIILDLNGLKQINDTRGHLQDDELICRTAQVIQDFFSSVGGATASAVMSLRLSAKMSKAQRSKVQYRR